MGWVMKRLLVCSVFMIAAFLTGAAMAEDWHFVGSAKMAGSRVLNFIDVENVSPPSDGVTSFEWSTYWEKEPTNGAVPNNRWKIYRIEMKCDENTYRSIATIRMNEADGSVSGTSEETSVDFKTVETGLPIETLAAFVCQRGATVKTLPLKGTPIPAAAEMLFPQLP